MALVETEQVLVVPTERFHSLGHFQGFSGEVEKYFEELLSPIPILITKLPSSLRPYRPGRRTRLPFSLTQ